MLVLSELIDIITEFHTRVDLLPHGSRRRDTVSQLYDQLRNKNLTEEAIRKLEERTSKQYVAVAKTRLRKKLLNTLYFIEPIKGRNSDQTIAFIQIQKQLYKCYLLQRFGGDHNLCIECRRGLNLAVTYHLTKEALEFAVMLRSYFCRNGAVAKFNLYRDIADQQQRKYTAELEAIFYYQQFIIHYYKRISYQRETITSLRNNIKAITRLKDAFDSLTISVIYYRLSVYNYDITAQYHKVYDVCQQAIHYLHKTAKVATKSDFAEFYLYQLGSCIYTRDLRRGSAAYAHCIALYPEATSNWFTCQESYLLLLFHTQEFAKAESIVSTVLRHRAFKYLPEFIREKWLVYDLYLQYGLGALGAPKRGPSSRRMLRSMIQRTHELKNDKSGFAFSVRLIYILSLLEAGVFDELTEQIDAFRIYCNRYFPLQEYPKTRAFLKLIFLIEKHSYNHLIIKAKATKYLEQLNASEIAHREANENIQILPYDLIWKHMMDAIQTNSLRRVKNRLSTRG